MTGPAARRALLFRENPTSRKAVFRFPPRTKLEMKAVYLPRPCRGFSFCESRQVITTGKARGLIRPYKGSVPTGTLRYNEAGGPGGRGRPPALVSFSETTTRGCAGASKKAFAVSFERSRMVFNTQRMQHATGRTPFTGGGANNAGDSVFSAS